MYKEGDLTHFNQKLEGFTLTRCWDECLASSQYHARKSEIDKFNKYVLSGEESDVLVLSGVSYSIAFLLNSKDKAISLMDNFRRC